MHYVKQAEYIDGYRVTLTFEDGNVKIIDLLPYLEGEVFEPLKNPNYFKDFKVDFDADTIVWPNGADFSPDFLYEKGQSYLTGNEQKFG
ncbi:MAG TPA: DUF2442 domain-containing protein [Cyanobacteria bacterium UBA8530]|nr:DUF2442 domain-containing protein [Cyanobacteria bacterium UBA8530]